MTKRFPIPGPALLHHTAVLGKTGSGKTSTAKLIVEHVVEQGARVCVLDPIKSDWWGLISSADGKRPGLPFHVLGGPHGHVPLHSGAGKAIGELVARGELPLSIVDMADFEPGGVSRFFVDFCQTLHRRMRGAIYLVLEEAHEFAPKERSGIGQENMAIHWAKKLATAGRSKGIRLLMVTQRTQSLHNALLGSCETVIVHRLTSPADQAPVTKWLAANVSDSALRTEISSTMSSLPTGTGWLCSGEAQAFERVRFPRIKTYDNTATPTGDSDDVEVTAAKVDVERLREIIGTAVEEAEANDPARLKARIRDLERQVRTAGADGLEQEIRRLTAELDSRDERIAQLEAYYDEIEERITDALSRIAAAIRAAAKEVELELPPRPTVGVPPADSSPHLRRTASSTARAAARSVKQTPPRRATGGSASSLGRGERIILTAIAQHPDGCDAEQLSVLTGYKRSSRDTYLQKLRAGGLITPGWPTVATDAGLAALGADFEPLPTGAELRRYWLGRLSGGERAILEVLIAAYPSWLTKQEIDRETGYKRSSRDTYLQKLRARKLVDVERGEARASERLF